MPEIENIVHAGKEAVIGLAAVCLAVVFLDAEAQSSLLGYGGKDDAIEAPLIPIAGDAARGREVVLSRDAGNCLLCHAVPDSGLPRMGNIASSLAGVGARYTAGQLRLLLVDASRRNPGTLMPSYYRVEGLNDVAAAWKGKPILSAQQMEDVIAYLLSLKDSPK